MDQICARLGHGNTALGRRLQLRVSGLLGESLPGDVVDDCLRGHVSVAVVVEVLSW